MTPSKLPENGRLVIEHPQNKATVIFLREYGNLEMAVAAADTEPEAVINVQFDRQDEWRADILFAGMTAGRNDLLIKEY